MAEFRTLIDVAELQKLLASTNPLPVVLDCRSELLDHTAGRRAFDAAHIPGAHHMDMETDLSGPVVPGVSGRHPLPDPDLLAERFRTNGVGRRSQVICYDHGPGAFAARAWWLLRWLGHANVAVLDGGWSAWIESGGAQQTTPPTTPTRGDLQRGGPLTRLIERAGLHGPSAPTLVDARDAARYRGEHEPIDPRAGHIPGAANRPFADNLDGGRFRAPDALRAAWEQLGAASAHTAHYCGSGVTACHNILSAVHAGLPEPMLYAGSFSEWVADDARPIQVVTD